VLLKKASVCQGEKSGENAGHTTAINDQLEWAICA
jgi:hypothetical protein